MQVNIEIIEKPEIGTKATFNIKDFNTPKDFKESMAIIFMICADYYLDPELEIEDLIGFIEQAKERTKDKLALFADESGIELEFLD